MRYCRSKEIRTPYLIVTVICLLLLFVSIMITQEVYTVERLQSLWHGAAWCLVFILFCALLTLVFVLQTIWQFRKYTISSDGISVAYFKRFAKHYTWNAISEIGICRVHFSTKGGSEMVLRIVIGPEPCGPSYGYGQWTYLRYSMIHHSRIVIIDYSTALHSEIEALCPLKICDYRYLTDH